MNRSIKTAYPARQDNNEAIPYADMVYPTATVVPEYNHHQYDVRREDRVEGPSVAGRIVRIFATIVIVIAVVAIKVAIRR